MVVLIYYYDEDMIMSMIIWFFFSNLTNNEIETIQLGSLDTLTGLQTL